jgi:hypothetical protein
METIDWIYGMACSHSKHLIAGEATSGNFKLQLFNHKKSVNFKKKSMNKQAHNVSILPQDLSGLNRATRRER